jgi:hypothetical protein
MIDPSDPDGKGFKFPVGFGPMRIALTLAAATHRWADGVDDTGSFLGNVAKDGILSNFSPVEPTDVDPSKDAAKWAMQQFTPTIAKPLLQLALNQTGQGSVIHQPDEWTGNKMKFLSGKPATSGIYRDVAKVIYDKTGIDIYPETIPFLLQAYGGGGALDAMKAIDALGEKSGVDKSLSDLPAVRAFGSGALRQDMTDFLQNSKDAAHALNERKYAESQGTVDQFDADNPGVVETAAMYDAANRQLKELNKERVTALNDEDPARRQELAREINRQIRAIQMRVNAEYRNLQHTQ